MSAVVELVRRAWRETLDASPGDASWEEAGGDSLATLHLVYRLEQLLGRGLALDLIQPEMTLATMAAAVDRGTVAADDGLPCVFLVPGVNGDESGLVRFRRALAGDMRFELVEPLRLETPARLLTDVAAAGRIAAAEIARRAPVGPLLVAGYSFGGGVALEAAAALIAAGRTVALVAVLDTAFGDAVLGPPRLEWRRRWRRRLRDVATSVVAHDGLRRLVIRLAERIAPGRALALRQLLMRWLRTRARLRWRPSPVEAPFWVVLSDEFAPRTEAAWGRHFPHVTIVRIRATHLSLIRGEGLPVLTRAFADAVAGARER